MAADTFYQMRMDVVKVNAGLFQIAVFQAESWFTAEIRNLKKVPTFT